MRKSLLLCTAILGSVFVIDAKANEIIDFETGFSRGDVVPTVATPSNTVTFSLSPNVNNVQPVVAEVGTLPREAFESGGGALGDTPFDSTTAMPYAGSGQYFLSDGAGERNDWELTFSTPVTHVSLDLYDFLDGGAGPGDFVLFRALGTDGASVGSDVYAIPRPRPFDGSFVTLSIPAPTGLIKTVELIFSNFDRGTGIDNIQFQTVPEPASMLLACAGIISMLLIRRHRRLPCR